MRKIIKIIFTVLYILSLAGTNVSAQTDWLDTQWIGLDKMFAGDTPSNHSRLSRYLRKEFQTENKPVKNATLHICGLGLYEAYINGVKTGDYVHAPTLTDYSKSVKYNTFDITAKIRGNERNAVAVILGNGRYFSVRYEGKGKMRNFGFPKMLAQIEIVYKDGSRQIVVSDSTWRITADGPIRANNEFDGEEYDARKELTGWEKAGYNDNNWLHAENVAAPAGKLEAQTNRNIKVMDTVNPVKITQASPSVYVLDMGQNMAGWLQMKVRGEPDDTVTLRFAENLNADGSINTANLRTALATDKYICKGGGEETWEPKFVYHGFRYVEIRGGSFDLTDFVGKVIYDEMETVGSFECSDTTLNRIYRNAFWGIRGNYHSMPTDCPQRDERQGWLGDRTTGALGESFVFNNHDLYAKWLDDIEQAQHADGALPPLAPIFWNWNSSADNMTWPAACLTVADMLYRQFGDLQPIAKHYDSMKRWLDYMRSNYLKDGIMAKDKYGDWCVPPESPALIHSEDSTRMTDGALLGTTHYYRVLSLMEDFAHLLAKNEDAAAFSSEKETVKHAFNARFLNTGNKQYSNNTVTANFLPLCFGMIPKEYEEAVFRQITHEIETKYNSHVSTGVVGIQWLMRGLTEHGRGDLALKIATNRDYPSWGYMLENGATAIWELWNGNTADPGMNSGNHVMLLGDLLVWFYQYLGGIRNAEGSAGYRQIELKPYPIDGLDFANASYQLPQGLIVSNWKKDGKRLIWNITIPRNATAKVFVPVKNGYEVKEYKAGSYQIKSKIK
jgi:alpha-L-rhamnosidase